MADYIGGAGRVQSELGTACDTSKEGGTQKWWGHIAVKQYGASQSGTIWATK